MVKILLVEDNPLNQDMLSRRLTRQGFEVVIAMDGAAALSMAKREQPDLILMDMNIPIIDGWETTKRLKADGQTQSVPVVALTAHAMVGDREKAMAAGCDDYATKPVEFKQLLKIIRSYTADITTSNITTNKESSGHVAPQPAPAGIHLSTPRSIPTRPASSLSTPTAAAQPPVDSANDNALSTLLIVNDNVTNRQILSTHLQRKGYTVVAVDDAQTALDILQEFSIELVLLDIVVPENGNLQALQKIREMHSKASLAVIVMTAQDSDDSIVKAFEMGVSDYMSKPINLAITMARIQSQIETLQVTRQQISTGVSSSVPAENTPLSAEVSQPSHQRSFPDPDIVPAPVFGSRPAPKPEPAPASKPAPASRTALQSKSTRAASRLPSGRLDRMASKPATATKKSTRKLFKALEAIPDARPQPIKTNPRAVLVHTRAYPLNYVFSETALGQMTLIESPNPSSRLWCLMETFTPNLSSDALMEKLRAVVVSEISQLEAISKNDGIAELLSFVEKDGTLCWLQAYTQGYLLAEEVSKSQRTAVSLLLTSIQDILEALLPFHRQNIVHSSVQPKHLWRERSTGKVVLINLGISQRLCGYLAQYALEKRKDFALEHPYMPIEQRIGQPILSSDIYAVGLILLQLLTGKTTTVLTSTLLSHGLSFDYFPMVPPELEPLLTKMLSQEAVDRYPSALEALQDVRQLIDSL